MRSHQACIRSVSGRRDALGFVCGNAQSMHPILEASARGTWSCSGEWLLTWARVKSEETHITRSSWNVTFHGLVASTSTFIGALAHRQQQQHQQRHEYTAKCQPRAVPAADGPVAQCTYGGTPCAHSRPMAPRMVRMRITQSRISDRSYSGSLCECHSLTPSAADRPPCKLRQRPQRSSSMSGLSACPHWNHKT